MGTVKPDSRQEIINYMVTCICKVAKVVERITNISSQNTTLEKLFLLELMQLTVWKTMQGVWIETSATICCVILTIYNHSDKPLPKTWAQVHGRFCAQGFGNGFFCSSVVEHWSSIPEDAGSIPSRKALELHFSQLVPVWVL